MPSRDIKTVMEAHVDELMAITGVVGVYVGETGDGIPCIKVMAARKTPELAKQVPEVLEGHPGLIHETGEIKGLSGDG